MHTLAQMTEMPIEDAQALVRAIVDLAHGSDRCAAEDDRRPARQIDQAIEIGLPDASARRRPVER